MSPFWSSLFSQLRDCGRNATLFVFALAGCLGVLVLAIIVCQSELLRFILPVLPGLGLLAVAWVCVAIRRACVRRRERLLRSPLSDDELRVARLKLRKPRR
jgi:hypothetical protein